MKYSISKALTGMVVRYECPKCKGSLRSPLKEAGQNDVCPDCQTSFVVPGAKELQAHEAIQLTAQRQKEIAKEEKRRERESQKQSQIEQEQRKLAEVNRLEQKRVDQEQKRHEMLAGTSFDPKSHDWSTGGPYVYDFVEMGVLSGDWKQSLGSTVNQKTIEGWEYIRSESLVASRSNGCLMAFLGSPTTEFNVVVLVFRKPSPLLAKERSVDAELR